MYCSLPSGLKLDLEGELEFYPREQRPPQFFVDLRAHIIKESSWVCTEEMPLGGIHLPSLQEFPYYPGGLAKDELIRLLIFACFIEQV